MIKRHLSIVSVCRFIFQNTEVKKKNPNRYGYDVYEEQFDEFGEQINRNVLGKYDEEIDGVQSSSFSIGTNLSDVRDQKRRLMEVISMSTPFIFKIVRLQRNSFSDQIQIGWKTIRIVE